ncbi:MAG: hypothetical protein ACK4MV_05625 [Beijerinckiaceae bacterium]
MLLFAAIFGGSHEARAQFSACGTGPTAGYINQTTGTASTNSVTGLPELGSTLVPVDNTIYCVDYTVHKGTGIVDYGYVQFQLLVVKTSLTNPPANDTSLPGGGNLQIVGIAPTAYYSVSGAGIMIPPGGTETSYAVPVTITSSNIYDSTAIPVGGVNPDSIYTADGDDSMIRGLSFTFTYGADTITVANFTHTNNPTISGGSYSNCGNANCDLHATYSSTSPNLAGGGLANEIGDAIPEIDGAKLPQVLLLLSAAYLICRRRAGARSSTSPSSS